MQIGVKKIYITILSNNKYKNLVASHFNWSEKGILKKTCLAKIAPLLASKNEAPSRDVKLSTKIWCWAPEAGLEKSCAVTV